MHVGSAAASSDRLALCCRAWGPKPRRPRHLHPKNKKKNKASRHVPSRPVTSRLESLKDCPHHQATSVSGDASVPPETGCRGAEAAPPAALAAAGPDPALQTAPASPPEAPPRRHAHPGRRVPQGRVPPAPPRRQPGPSDWLSDRVASVRADAGGGRVGGRQDGRGEAGQDERRADSSAVRADASDTERWRGRALGSGSRGEAMTDVLRGATHGRGNGGQTSS